VFSLLSLSQKNGEKKLRALLCRTAEWADPDARLGVAAACASHTNAEGLATLGAVMSGRSTSAALRKSDLLHLTRCWGFRSDLWCRRNARKRSAPILDAPPPPLAPRRAEVKAAARAAAVAAAEHAAAKQAASAAKANSRQQAVAAYAAAFGGAPYAASPYGQHAASLYAQQQQQAASLQAQALHMFGYGGSAGGYSYGQQQYGGGGGGLTGAQTNALTQQIFSAAAQVHSGGSLTSVPPQPQQQRRAPPQLQLPAGVAAAFAGGPVSPLGDVWNYGWNAPQQQPPPAPAPAPVAAPPAPAALPAAAPAASAGGAPVALGSAAGLDAVSICAYIRSCLAPLATDAAAAFGGRDARDAALFFGAAHVTPACAAQVSAAACAAATTAAAWRARAADTAAQAAAVTPEGASAVAWQCFLGAAFPLDRWLAELPDALHAEEAACPSRGVRLGDAPLTPAEEAWAHELRRGRLAALEMINHLQSLVAQVKLSSLGTCLRVAAAAAEVVAAYTADVAAQLGARGAWMRDLIASGAGGTDAAPQRGRPLFVWAAPHRGTETQDPDDKAGDKAKKEDDKDGAVVKMRQSKDSDAQPGALACVGDSAAAGDAEAVATSAQ
jgi:hypothetical protein